MDGNLFEQAMRKFNRGFKLTREESNALNIVPMSELIDIQQRVDRAQRRKRNSTNKLNKHLEQL